jgi:hypothetical protein
MGSEPPLHLNVMVEVMGKGFRRKVCVWTVQWKCPWLAVLFTLTLLPTAFHTHQISNEKRNHSIWRVTCWAVEVLDPRHHQEARPPSRRCKRVPPTRKSFSLSLPSHSSCIKRRRTWRTTIHKCFIIRCSSLEPTCLLCRSDINLDLISTNRLLNALHD